MYDTTASQVPVHVGCDADRASCAGAYSPNQAVCCGTDSAGRILSRTAHAVRAIDAVDTPPRRSELARALGYWAARYREGQQAGPLPPTGDLRWALVAAAADGARRYLARPDIFHLHGVTGAMAVQILAAHIPATEGAAALAQVRAEHAALYAATEPVTRPHSAGPPGSELAAAAVRSLDPHQVKLVEACQRGHAVTGDPAPAGVSAGGTSPMS